MEEFKPKYCLVYEDDKVMEVSKEEYQKAAGPCGPHVTGFALINGIRGFVAESQEDYENQRYYHEVEWKQGLEATRARVHAAVESTEEEDEEPVKLAANT